VVSPTRRSEIDPDFSLAVREAVAEVCPALGSTGSFDSIRRHVWEALGAGERAALLAAYSLGGAPATITFLEAHVGEDYGWIPERYVRLREPRRVYAVYLPDPLGRVVQSHYGRSDARFVKFLGDVGWCRVRGEVVIAVQRANDSELVPPFEVRLAPPPGRIVDVEAG
jgi:hypothetical protein